MSDKRIRISKSKEDIVKKLRFSETGMNGVFKHYSDLVVFAAMLGYRYDRYVPFFDGTCIDPIRPSVFKDAGLEKLFYLLAFTETEDPEVFAKSDEATEKRVEIIEGYANGGLEILQEKLLGKDDPLDYLLLMISSEKSIAI